MTILKKEWQFIVSLCATKLCSCKTSFLQWQS